MNKKFAVIVSQFNQEITDKLKDGAIQRLKDANISENDIALFQVPGAIEIPLVAKLVAESKKFHAIICLGAVIRGDTSHYDYVCQQVSFGCQRVMLDFNIPVIFGVLTTETEEQALDRVGGKAGHKGIEAADAAIAMVELVAKMEIQE